MERGSTLYSIEGNSWSSRVSDGVESARKLSEDERLVRQCLAGSQEAWSTLIEKYRNLIYSIPIRKGLAQEDANEIFQEVCLKLVAELPRLREARGLAAWLIRVTTHSCFRWLGRRNRAPSLNPALRGQNEGEFSGSAETMLAEIEREQTLRDAVASLTGRCQRLIRMLFFTVPRPSYEEIALELAIAKGSIGFNRVRCFESLRRFLEERGFR